MVAWVHTAKHSLDTQIMQNMTKTIFFTLINMNKDELLLFLYVSFMFFNFSVKWLAL